MKHRYPSHIAGVLATNHGDYWSADVIGMDAQAPLYSTARPTGDRAISAAFNGYGLSKRDFHVAHRSSKTIHFVRRPRLLTKRRRRLVPRRKYRG